MLFACLTYVSAYSQVGVIQYRTMYDTIKVALHIDSAYVSDSLREHETLALSLYQMKLRDSIPLYNPYAERQVEYSKILQSNFNVIEDVTSPKGLYNNVIYFSLLDETYISAYAYVGVKTMSRKFLFPFPFWTSYDAWYEFLFQINDGTVMLLRKIRLYEM